MRDRLDALVAVGDDDPHSPLHRIKTGSFVFERGRPAGAALESAPGRAGAARRRWLASRAPAWDVPRRPAASTWTAHLGRVGASRPRLCSPRARFDDRSCGRAQLAAGPSAPRCVNPPSDPLPRRNQPSMPLRVNHANRGYPASHESGRLPSRPPVQQQVLPPRGVACGPRPHAGHCPMCSPRAFRTRC